MEAEEITNSIGIPHLTLENFELADPDTRYILTSPRSLQACDRCGVRPVELLRTPIEEFYDRYKDRDYLTRTDILDEFHLQEKLRLSKLSQAREERQRIIYLEIEEEAVKIPSYLHEKGSRSSPRKVARSPSPSRKSSPTKRVAWDSSTKGAQLPVRSSLESCPDSISASPVRTHRSWVDSLRSPDIPQRATSTPVQDRRSHDDIEIIGNKNNIMKQRKPAKRSQSVPRNTARASSSRTNLTSKSDTRLSGRVSNEELRTSYDRLQGAHRELTANVSQLEKELKALKIQQRRDEAVQKKKANIEALKLRKQASNAAARTGHSKSKLQHVKRLENGATAYAIRQLHNMESTSRAHLLRETQAHINELKTEIKQYKTQRASRLIQEDRDDWEELITTRQSRALQRAEVKAKRHVRDKSAKARQTRLERERLHAQNMRRVTQTKELELLRNLDNIITKDKKAEYLISEKQRMLKKCRKNNHRSSSARTRTNKSFDKMSHEAEMMARIESRHTAARWR